MKPHHYICIPTRFTSATLPATWEQMQSTLQQESGHITIDLHELQFLDPEPANHLVLMAHLLHRLGATVRVQLPHRQHVCSYLETIGLSKNLARFATLDRSSGVPADRNAREHNLNQRSLWPRAHSYFFECAADGLHDTRSGFLRLRIFRETLQNEAAFARVTTCFLELTQNTYDHSGERAGCVTFRLAPAERSGQDTQVLLAITDIGIGIKASLRQAANLADRPEDADDATFLQLAVLPGVTRTGFSSRGRGLATVASLADRLDIWSGAGFLSCKREQHQAKRIAHLPGTSLRATFSIGSGA